MSLREMIPAFLILVSFFSVTAGADEAQPYFLWASPGAARAKSGDHTQSAMNLAAGLQFPDGHEKVSFGVSAERLFFGPSGVDRTDFIFNAGYRLLPRLQPAILAGVEYVTAGKSYLKPVLGAKIDLWVLQGTPLELSVTAAYKVAQGDTLSIALDSGPDDLSAKILSVGMTFWFRLIE